MRMNHTEKTIPVWKKYSLNVSEADVYKRQIIIWQKKGMIVLMQGYQMMISSESFVLKEK